MKGIDVIVEQAGIHYQVAVVRVLGQIDTTTSHELERRLQYLLKDQQFEIAIDLSRVNYISSAGWGIFISEIRGIRESGGDLKLAGMTPEVAEVFELLEFHNILESYRTVEAAVETFERTRMRRGPGASSSSTSDGTGEVEEIDGIDETTGASWTNAAAADRTDLGTAPGRSELGTAPRRTDAGAPPSASATPEEGEVVPGAPPDATWAENKSLDSIICEIVRENPEFGCLRIRKELSARGNSKQLSPLAVFAQLKRMNLETREKRKQYAESGREIESKK
jgi:anti-sigma B factor antagonist